MLRFVVNRLLLALPTLWAVLTLVFFFQGLATRNERGFYWFRMGFLTVTLVGFYRKGIGFLSMFYINDPSQLKWSFALIGVPLGIKVSRRETSANLGVAVLLGHVRLDVDAGPVQRQHPEVVPPVQDSAPSFHRGGRISTARRECQKVSLFMLRRASSSSSRRRCRQRRT